MVEAAEAAAQSPTGQGQLRNPVKGLGVSHRRTNREERRRVESRGLDTLPEREFVLPGCAGRNDHTLEAVLLDGVGQALPGAILEDVLDFMRSDARIEVLGAEIVRIDAAVDVKDQRRAADLRQQLRVVVGAKGQQVVPFMLQPG